jgi:hypothetical protein
MHNESLMKEQPLQEWFNQNKPDDNLLWKDGLARQVIFVRDTLSFLLFSSYEEYEQNRWQVVSTHTSKSVKLPVYHLRMPSGLCFTMRDNFYDWKVSVELPTPLEIDPSLLFDPDETISPVYFEGFPRNRIYGSYNDDPTRFSVEIRNDYEVYCFMLLLRQAMKKVQDPTQS